MSILVSLALISLAYFFVWPLVPNNLEPETRKWILLGIGIVCLLPQIAYELVFPHPFSITAHKDSVDYEFREKVMADEFAALNRDAEWVKVECHGVTMVPQSLCVC